MTFDESRLTPNSPAYQRLHRWVRKELGKADHCSINPTHKSTRYDWSNISKQYLSEFSDWRQLCRACHRAYDPITPAGRKRLSTIKKVQSLGNQSHAKPVLMMFPRGHWIKFASSIKASQITGVRRTSIANAISGYSMTAGGYRWKQIGG